MGGTGGTTPPVFSPLNSADDDVSLPSLARRPATFTFVEEDGVVAEFGVPTLADEADSRCSTSVGLTGTAGISSAKSSQAFKGDPLSDLRLAMLGFADIFFSSLFFAGGGVADRLDTLGALVFDLDLGVCPRPSSLRSASAVSASTFCIESDCLGVRPKYEVDGLMELGGVPARLLTEDDPRRN